MKSCPCAQERRLAMARFEDYANKYTHIQMERHDGILQMRLHTDGGTLHWGEAHTRS
jgi:hypothetical protein